MAGNKHDNDKIRMDLVPVEALTGMADILTDGAHEYGEYNWAEGLDYSRVYAALQRHLIDFWRGEDIDPKSGKHHLDHAACELAFLQTYVCHKRYEKHDDRPSYGESEV